MAFSFLYLALRALLGALVHSRRGLHVKDVELLVLRVGFANSGGLVFVDESADEVAAAEAGSRVQWRRVAAVGREKV